MHVSPIDPARPEGRALLGRVAESIGTPCYAYALDHVVERVETVRAAFDGVLEISYAVKANPNRELLRRLRGVVDHLDLSSGGELLLAEEAGWSPGDCTFVAPAKAEWELAHAIDRECGWLIAESERELHEISALATARSRTVRVALRINPLELPKGFGVSMSRRPTIFGVDEERMDDAIRLARSLPGIDLGGFHVYAGTQCLVDDSIAENLRNTVRIFQDAVDRLEAPARLLVFGSGFGIPYHAQAEPIDLEKISASALGSIRSLEESGLHESGAMSLELGRYLVGESGVFLARVVHVKETRGAAIAALDGGMNHHLAASGNLGGVIKRNYPIYNVSREPAGDDGVEVDLAGPMCTNIDTLGRSVALPRAEPGDVIGIGCSGAYGVTASPVAFISHRPPREALVIGSGPEAEIVDITEHGTIANPPPWPEAGGGG